jgi:hypothetical protein
MRAWPGQADVRTHRGAGLWLLIGASVLLAFLVPTLLLAFLPVLTSVLLFGLTPWDSPKPVEALVTLQLPKLCPRGPPNR